jgi:formamidopyrimidine-DNA glycosylase
MPELPEIETIKRGLQGLILNTKIVQCELLNAKSFRGDIEQLVGRKIIKIDRKGKALLMRLDDGRTILGHMRMTGQLIYIGSNQINSDLMKGNRFAAGHPDGNFVAEMPSRHTRVWFEFEDGGRLYFNDLRKFGYLALMDEADLARDKFLQELAPEPWDMSAEAFYDILQKHAKTTIKAVLLNQKLICGLGNIYADESCYVVGIFPGVLAGDLSRDQANALLNAACDVMRRSIDSGGSTMKDYVKPDGTRGNYLDKFAQVFRRDGEPCLKCGTQILKIRVAGRGTHFCPHCQPEHKKEFVNAD